MKKVAVIRLFGSVSRTAAAVGVTPQAVSDWPDILTDAIADRVRGTCVRLGMKPIDIEALDPPTRAKRRTKF